MSTNNLYGKNFIKMLKSSGYKSSIYAMAEIVDNSVDAGATNIDIIFIQNEVIHGQKTKTRIEKIVFIDNGKGMNEDVLNGCLTFSEGAGRTHDRIGAFGVGLPNSSISVGNRVDIYSRVENFDWNYVFLDVNDQSGRNEAVYDKSKPKTPDANEIGFNIELLNKAKTIVVWSEFDRLDAAKAETLITRGESC
jgi:DNA topoisomerase VI subunit B